MSKSMILLLKSFCIQKVGAVSVPKKIQCPGISGRQVTVKVGSNVRIHPTAKFGPGVVIGNNVLVGAGSQIGAQSRLHDNITVYAHATLGDHMFLDQVTVGSRSSIGAHSTIVNSKIEARVTIGPRANCLSITIVQGATIGEQFSAEGFGGQTTVISRVIIGNNVHVEGPCIVGRYGHDPRTRIGHKTRIINRYGLAQSIADHVTIGEGCLIQDSNIGKNSSIGSETQITRANVNERVSVGQGVIIRPSVTVPVDWLIPDNTIVNPNPGSNIPVVIPRPPKPRY